MEYETVIEMIDKTLQSRGYAIQFRSRLSNPHTNNNNDVYRALKEGEDRPNCVVKITTFPKKKYAERYQLTMNRFRPLTRSHPNLVTIIDDVEKPIQMNEDESVAYILMEGGNFNLDSMVEQFRKVDPREAIKVIRQTCNALKAVYEEGYVHRDVKTSNIIVTIDKNGEKTYKLCDFNTMAGVDKEDETSLASMSSFAQGTKHYFAPELNLEREVGNVDLAVRDIYSLGIILYQLLTGMSQKDLFKLKFIGEKDITQEEYRKLQREPENFFKYLGLEETPAKEGVKKALPDNLFLFREVIKILLFYDPSKQEAWETLPEGDPGKLSGPGTPWHGRYQDYEELFGHIAILDHFDLMAETAGLLDVDIRKEPGRLLGNLGRNPDEGVWNRMIRLRGGSK